MEGDTTVLALVGERAEERALAEAAPETEICRDTDIPFFPALGMRQNAVNLRMVMEPEQISFFPSPLAAPVHSPLTSGLDRIISSYSFGIHTL